MFLENIQWWRYLGEKGKVVELEKRQKKKRSGGKKNQLATHLFASLQMTLEDSRVSADFAPQRLLLWPHPTLHDLPLLPPSSYSPSPVSFHFAQSYLSSSIFSLFYDSPPLPRTHYNTPTLMFHSSLSSTLDPLYISNPLSSPSSPPPISPPSDPLSPPWTFYPPPG